MSSYYFHRIFSAIISKVKVEFKIDGGRILNYRIEDKEEFEIVAIIRNFSNKTKSQIYEKELIFL